MFDIFHIQIHWMMTPWVWAGVEQG